MILPSIDNFNITDDNTILDSEYGINDYVREALEEAYHLARKPKAANVKKLKGYIKKYPRVPHFKNYLSVCFSDTGRDAEAQKVIELTIEQHPNYFYGRLNRANMYLDEEQYEKIPELLGEAMDLPSLYPQRPEFHIDEIKGFYFLAVRYYLAIDKEAEAEHCYQFLKEVAPDSESSDMAFSAIQHHNMQKSLQRMEEAHEKRITLDFEAPAQQSTQTEAPEFTHAEVEELYHYDTGFYKALSPRLLALPRHSLIADLELVLRDSINRFNHFDELWENEELDLDFVMHALYLLGELKAKESLPVVFEVLSQHEGYYDLYIGEWIHEDMWEPIYKMHNATLDDYQAFMLQPNKYTYAKNVLIVLLEQIAVHQPERKEEVYECFKSMLEAYNQCSLNDNIIDSDLIAFIACTMADIKGADAAQYLQPLFEKGWVSVEICGSLEDLQKERRRQLRELPLSTLDECYDKLESWHTESPAPAFDDEDDEEDDTPWGMPEQPIVNDVKTGRNDPCPCGSGKKYKKCCLNK
ncbi:DUF1186 domain-containing protein [Carboxylicivirga marina]|uniref:DUF1186 domain-containing protein n=1 Tax=Carboxylicivirga marina TaxID=2800988 RepID=UPI0025988DC3|nr:DUF1186 domain-containing protein [Carboxylicivirga marina]